MEGRSQLQSDGTFKMFLMAICVSTVVSCVVLFKLGPVMLERQQGAPASWGLARVDPAQLAPTPARSSAPDATRTASELAAPNLVGLELADARQRWSSLGLEVLQETTRTDPSVPAGTILEQNPRAGAPLEERQISVVVATRAVPLTMPDFRGHDQVSATTQLEALGLSVAVVEREAGGARPGSVLEQDPSPQSTTRVGARVQLTVADSRRQIPQLRGKRLAVARKILEDAGFEIGSISRREHTELAGGRVLDQVPEAGARGPKGSKIDLVVVAPD